MKIIICKGQFLGPISGADEILVNYAIQLHRSGHEVSVLLLYPQSPLDQYHKRLREAGVSIHIVARNPVGAFVNTGRRLAPPPSKNPGVHLWDDKAAQLA